jgi:hypothetical protein
LFFKFVVSLFKGSYRRMLLPDRCFTHFNFPARWSIFDRFALLFRQSVVSGSLEGGPPGFTQSSTSSMLLWDTSQRRAVVFAYGGGFSSSTSFNT